jgi:DNA invertase Pin-like site-specific DNA recombinase
MLSCRSRSHSAKCTIGARTRDGLAEARAQGKRLGRPRMIAPELLARIVELHEDGASNRAIAGELNAEGVPTVNGGKKWHHGTIGGLIASVRLDAELETTDSTSKEG